MPPSPRQFLLDGTITGPGVGLGGIQPRGAARIRQLKVIKVIASLSDSIFVVPNGQITAAADGGTNREDESESGGFHASIRCPTKSSPKVAEGGAGLATATSKRPTCGPTPEQRLEVQRLVLLRLHAVVRSHPQNPGRSGGCRRRSAKALAHQRATRCYAQVPWRCG